MPTRIPFAARIPSRLFALGGALLVAGASPAQAQEISFVEPAVTAHVPVALGQGPVLTQVKADLGKGFDMLRAGKQARAVEYFDRVITAFDHGLAGDGRQRLCATKTMGPTVPEGAVLVDDAVCDAHFGKGFALIDMGRGDLAEAELRTASEMEPQNAHFANEYAELYKSRRDWNTAYGLFEKAWTVADKSLGGPDADLAARALRGMGYCKAKMGDLSEARRLLEQSLTFDPGNQAARIELDHVSRMVAIGS